MTQTQDTRAGDRYAGHTPGPWRVDGETVCEAETDDVIAQPGDNFSMINPSQTLSANARLIAAAPKLLAENRRLREALQSCGELASCAPHDNGDLANQEFTKIMRIARAALADTEVQS